MKRLKNFLEKYEQSYLFPSSRLVWIVFSMIFILGSFFYGISYLIDGVPNSRMDVHINPEELRRNKVILEEEQEKYAESTKKSYDKQIDSLKRLTPKSEWNVLFFFKDEIEYVSVSKYQPGRYDPWMGYYYDGYYYTDYEQRNVKRKVDNDTAYPVIIDQIFETQGIDSAYFSKKIAVVNILIDLHKRIPSKDANKIMKNELFSWLSYQNQLERSDVSRILSWMDKIEKKKVILGSDNKTSDNKSQILEVFGTFINRFAYDSISEERLELVDKTLEQLQLNGFKDATSNYKILEKVLSSPLDNEDCEVAVNDYFDDKLFKKTSKNKGADFVKYFTLFNQKIKIREAENTFAESERLSSQETNKEYFIIALLGIFQIAIILVLYSIHRSIKNRP